MAEVTISNSPVHSDTIITYPYGVVDYGYECDFHTGLDFAPYGSTGRNPDLYPVTAGEVVQVSTTGSLRLYGMYKRFTKSLLAILSHGSWFYNGISRPASYNFN